MNETKNAYIILLYTFPTVLDAASFSWGKKNKIEIWSKQQKLFKKHIKSLSHTSHIKTWPQLNKLFVCKSWRMNFAEYDLFYTDFSEELSVFMIKL